MSTASITIIGVGASYKPGESVSGSVEWSADTAPRSLEIKLFWMTSGAAPRQIGIVETYAIERPNPAGTSRFNFRLPSGPWSFKGALVRLSWAIEAVMLPTKQNAHVMFSVGPEGRPSDLYAKDDIADHEDFADRND